MKPESSCGVSSEMDLPPNSGQLYSDELFAGLDLAAPKLASGKSTPDHPGLSWRRSGLLQTTGLMLPLPLTGHCDSALEALKALAPEADLPDTAALMIGERARLRETVRKERFCAGGYGRLLDAKDGRIALNLVRDDDWDLIPAWLEDYIEDWDGIAVAVAQKSTSYLSERAAELGLAVAVDSLPERPKNWVSVLRFDKATPKQEPLIVDMSGLWAGPLASSLLQLCGARVIKIEGPERPDGMRNGHTGFYALLNGGKDCAAFDFRNAEDLTRLKALLARADIVIEASRPRALRQLGIIAEDFVSKKPGQVWARLTAYGQSENRIGFGDDIGISAGLATIMQKAHGEPCFVGDAIADPVNGVHLALAIRALMQDGGGAVIDMAMVDVLRFAMGNVPDAPSRVAREWMALAIQDDQPLYTMRENPARVHALSEDTQAIISELC